MKTIKCGNNWQIRPGIHASCRRTPEYALIKEDVDSDAMERYRAVEVERSRRTAR